MRSIMNLFQRMQRTPLSSVSASRARRQQRRQRPGLEALEGRQLLSLSGNDFIVSTPPNGAGDTSDVAGASFGGSVVVWQDPNSGGINAQIYNPDGSQFGGPIAVEPGGDGTLHYNPRVSMDPFGDFTVAYEEIPIEGDHTNIYAKQFDSFGNQIGGRIAIATSDLFSQFDPDVAVDASGNFVVTYSLTVSSTEQDVWAARFDASTGEVSQFPIAHSDQFYAGHSSIALGGNGQFDIAYDNQSVDTGESNISLAQFDSSFNLIGNGPLFGGLQPITGSNPNVAMDNAGNAVVVYQHNSDSAGPNPSEPSVTVTALRLDSFGDIVGSTDLGTGQFSQFPDVAMSPSGGWYVVAYETDLLGATEGNRTVEVAEVDQFDNWVGTANFPAFPDNFEPALGIDGSGNYTLTYTAFGNDGSEVIHGESGNLPVAPAAQNLALTSPIRPGHSVTLSGQLVDAAGDTNLTLTVNWGDGSKPEEIQPGLEPFALKHKYRHRGTYTVQATWSDNHGLSKSRDLILVVGPHGAKVAARPERHHDHRA
jgi:hypothetical protein